MPEKLQGKYFWRAGAALTMAAGSLALAPESEYELVSAENDSQIESTSFSVAVPAKIEFVEPTTTTTEPVTTTTETTTTTTAQVTTTTEAPPPPPVQYPAGCENYRGMVAQYNWPLEGAMRTMKEESGCNPNAVSSTDDHGLFQLHGQSVYDPAENIRIAYNMYVDARRGSQNFSAWYAVCTPDLQPKYPEVNCS